MKTAAFHLLLVFPLVAHADTFIVTNDNATGPGSMGAAMQSARLVAAGTPAVVEFDPVFFSVPRTIRLTTAVPYAMSILRGVEINGPPLLAGLPAVTISGDANQSGFCDAGDSVGLVFGGSGGSQSFTLRRIAFVLCAGPDGHGALDDNSNGEESLLVEDCTFSQCTLHRAVVCTHSGLSTFRRCRFAGNAAANGHGGAILSSGPLHLEACIFSGNSAANTSDTAAGGAVYAAGGGAFSDTAFIGNATEGAGGALWSTSCTVDRCTFAGNTCMVGTLRIETGSGPSTLTNCTFYDNRSTSTGSAAWLGAPALITHCTFTQNVAYALQTSGSYNSYTITAAAACTFANCLIAENYGSAARIRGEDMTSSSLKISAGGNIVSLMAGSGSFTLAGDHVGTVSAPLSSGLGPLHGHGGITPACAPLKNALAINNGLASAVASDQRGLARPSGSAPDSGAVEFKVLNYTQWAALYPFATAAAGQNDDPDRDGMSNILEYFTGTDPLVPSSSVLEVNLAGNQMRMTYPVADHVATNIWRPAFQISQNLTAWSPSSQTPVLLGQDGNTSRYEVFFNTSVPKRFARMFVEQIP